MSKKFNPFVEVWWQDHNTMGGGWTAVDDISRASKAVIIYTAGIIVHEDKDVVSICHSISDQGKALHAITILKTDITKRRDTYHKANGKYWRSGIEESA